MFPESDDPGQEMNEVDKNCALILMELSNRCRKKSVDKATVIKEEVEDDDGPMKCDQKTKFSCAECGKCYTTRSNLSRHKRTHSSFDSQPAKKCVICGKQFFRLCLLQGHLRSHTGEKPYWCDHCGKGFADRSNMRAHMQTHSSEKRFECPKCLKNFALKSYLRKHILKMFCVSYNKKDLREQVENAEPQTFDTECSNVSIVVE